MKKKIVMVMLWAAMIIMSITVSAANITPPNIINVDSQIQTTMTNVWATAAIIVRVAAVACVAFAGLRYMFASADQKADIKRGLIFLGGGAVLVFGATYIIQMVIGATNDIVN